MVDSIGIDRRTGKRVTDWAHVVSSLEDLLTTRLLSRVMLREYGSTMPELIDAPMNDASLMLFFSAVATACALWEPRVELTNLEFVEADRDGRVALRMVVNYMPRGHFGDRTVEGIRTAQFYGTFGAFVAIT
jgi:phage baseplate assembly protein W